MLSLFSGWGSHQRRSFSVETGKNPPNSRCEGAQFCASPLHGVSVRLLSVCIASRIGGHHLGKAGNHAGCLHPDSDHLHHRGHRHCICGALDDEFSRSGRTVEESRAWLKRIIITWVILNGLGFIMAYITPFFNGGQWTPPP